MRYFIFFLLLLLSTIVAMCKEDLDMSLLLLILDIFYIFIT